MKRTALLLALVATAPAAAKDPLAGRVPAAPRQCVSLSGGGMDGGLYVLDRSSIAYRRGGQLWRNVPIGRCTLRPLDTVIAEVNGGQLCRNDRFRTLAPQQSIPSAPCRLGDWVPYLKAK